MFDIDRDLYKDVTTVMMMQAYYSVTDFTDFHKNEVAPEVFNRIRNNICTSFRAYSINQILKYDVYTDQLSDVIDVVFNEDEMTVSTKRLSYGYADYFRDGRHDLLESLGNTFTDDARDTIAKMIQSGDKDLAKTGYFITYKAGIGGLLMHWAMQTAINLLSQIHPFDSYLSLSYTLNYWLNEIFNRPRVFLDPDNVHLIKPQDARKPGKDKLVITSIKPDLFAYPSGRVYMDKAKLMMLVGERKHG